MTTPTTEPDDQPTTATDVSPFRLDFRVKGGQLMASLPGPHDQPLEVHEWMTWLRVRSDLGLATMILGRHNGDLEGRPVGLFQSSLTRDELGSLRELVAAIEWAKLPTPTGGDVTGSTLSIDYAGDRLIQREFNAHSREFIAAIWPLMEALDARMSAMLAKPHAAMHVSAAAGPDPRGAGQHILQVTFSNPGSAAIVLTDPRAPSGASKPRARLFVTVAGDDLRPPVWTPIELPPLPEGAPEVITIAPGQRLDVPVAWRPPQPGSYYVRGEWVDYAGVPTAADHSPLMPTPEDLEERPPAQAGPYPIRGAAFANGVPFTVDAATR